MPDKRSAADAAAPRTRRATKPATTATSASASSTGVRFPVLPCWLGSRRSAYLSGSRYQGNDGPKSVCQRVAVARPSHVWSTNTTTSATAPTQHSSATSPTRCALPRAASRRIVHARGRHASTGAPSITAVGLTGAVNAHTRTIHPRSEGERARQVNASTAASPNATYDSGRVPRLKGSHAAAKNSAASVRTRAVPASDGSAAPSKPLLRTNHVAIANSVLGRRSHSGARLTCVSGANSSWLNANGDSGAFHQR